MKLNLNVFHLCVIILMLIFPGCISSKQINIQDSKTYKYVTKDVLNLLSGFSKKKHNKEFYDFIHIERSIEKNKVMLLCFTYNDKTICFDYDVFEYNQFNLNHSFKEINDFSDYNNLISIYIQYLNEKYSVYFAQTMSYRGSSIDEWESAILKTNEILSNVFEIESYSDFPVDLCYIPIFNVFEVRYLSCCGSVCVFENKKLSDECAKLEPDEQKEFIIEYEPKIDNDHCFLVLGKDMSIHSVSDSYPELNNFKPIIEGYKRIAIICGQQIW